MDPKDLRERYNILSAKKPGTVMELEELMKKFQELSKDAIDELDVILNLFKSGDLAKLSVELEREELEKAIFGNTSDFKGYASHSWNPMT